MRIVYIGGGFVGACSAAVSADSGHTVLVYDTDKTKVEKLGSNDREQIESCLFEDGLAELLIRNRERITFTNNYAEVEAFLDECEAVFMCLPTPEIDQTGQSDLGYYLSAAESLAEALQNRGVGRQKNYIVIVNKSTMPIEMVDTIKKILDDHAVKNVGVVANPEFLVEGKAIEGSIHPDRVVVGAWSNKDFKIMRELYQRFADSSTVQYLEVNPKEAAAGKLLANFYLFNKLAVCFDVVGRTCENFSDIQFETVRKIMSSDPRIGSWGLYDSLYAGGSCFIKDARSLSHQLESVGQPAVLVQEAYLANKRQLAHFLNRAQKEAGIDWKGKTIALLGLAFKQGTNDTRNAPSIDITKFLLEQGAAVIQAYDPVAGAVFAAQFTASKSVRVVSSEKEALKKADVVIVATDWPQFRDLSKAIIDHTSFGALIMDGRRMLVDTYPLLQSKGHGVIAVGSPFLPSISKK